MELGKLSNKCDVLQQWNTTLEEDKRNLVNQVSILLAQYHELLSQTLEEKDHFHEETKNFSDKLNNLKRQKEILEDKIMEQYRRMENCSSTGSPFKKSAKSSIGALFVRKMRRASTEFINRVPRSRSRNRIGDGVLSGDRESPDQHDGQADTFSIESGSQHSGSNSGCGSLDGGSGGEGDTLPSGSMSGSLTSPQSTSGTGWNDRSRQSMPIIHYQHSETDIPSVSSVHHSISSDALCNGSVHNQHNGNLISSPVHSSVNGNSVALDCDVVGASNAAAATNTSTTKPSSFSSNLVSAAPLMMMAPCPSSSASHTPQPSPRLNGMSVLQSTPANNSVPANLQRFTQSTRSLALLERAGSRQPLCISEVDPALALSEPSNLVLPLSSHASPLLTPRNASPAGSDVGANNNISDNIGSNNGHLVRTGAAPAQTPLLPTGAAPIDSSTPNSKLFPHLTSTTRINVNISTAAITPLTPSPSSPLLPGPMERRGSLRLPPRPSPRVPPIESGSPPLLPARTATQDRPALPPRSYPATTPTVEVKSTSEHANVNESNTGTGGSASSIWYEYGCV